MKTIYQQLKELTELREKLNMQRVYNMLKDAGFEPQIEEGNRLWIKAIKVGSDKADEKDWGGLKITPSGALYGDDSWGRDINNETEVIPALRDYIEDQKDYFKNDKSKKNTLTTPTSVREADFEPKTYNPKFPFPQWYDKFLTKLADRFDVEERDLPFHMETPNLMGVPVHNFSQEGLDNFPKDVRAILRTPEFKGKAVFTFDGTGKIEDRLVAKHPEFEDHFDDDEHYWIYIK